MPHVPPAGKLLPLPMPFRPWPHLLVDFITDLPVSEGNTAILSLVDQFSKIVHFVPLAALPTMLETADILFLQVFRHFGLPEDIVSDRGPQFTLRLWKELLGKLNITVSLTSGYHPQANRQVERVNQELVKFLYLYCQHHPESWNAYLPWAEYVQNSLRHMVWALWVYVLTKDGRAGATGKLKLRYEGPYTITDQINEVTYRVGLTGSSQASRAFHMSALKPMMEGPLTEEEGFCHEKDGKFMNSFKRFREHKDWALEPWKKVMWSDESTFTLLQSDGHIRVYLTFYSKRKMAYSHKYIIHGGSRVSSKAARKLEQVSWCEVPTSLAGLGGTALISQENSGMSLPTQKSLGLGASVGCGGYHSSQRDMHRVLLREQRYSRRVPLEATCSPFRGLNVRQWKGKNIQESLAILFIRPSTSPAGAGFFFVRKKDGGLCLYIDYRGLNKMTIKDHYPLPLMTSAFETLQQASDFTKLDLHSAYNLVRIQEGDEWETTFITPSGHYEYLIMLFGLMNAPAVFQRYINEVLREALDRYVFVYLDDILIYCQTVDEHVTHVRRVLQLLLENHLFVKLEKSTFHAQTISFLGFIVSHSTLCMDPAMVRAVESWPRPTSVRRIQHLTNFYRRFMKSFSMIATPLTMLTRKASGGFCW
ncbi:hypothetical protein P4O66_003342 [Electrophorus voltai]|uniref:ribonuclease H n=1 Tax=Electrophorus voltai TaxID=2609070 RepID=A0AAD8YRR7_9TELE|nr:hypothetical protein P4O66_003342 [Electrophorus voltai]